MLHLHRNPSKCICHRADQNNYCKDRTEILDHKVEHLLSCGILPSPCSTSSSISLHTDHPGYQQAGCNRRNRHHHGVCQEIKEIQELHADDLHTMPAGHILRKKEFQATSMITPINNRRFSSAPAKLILKGGYGAFCQGDGACQRRKQYQQRKREFRWLFRIPYWQIPSEW